MFKIRAEDHSQGQGWAAIYYASGHGKHRHDDASGGLICNRPHAEAILAATTGLLTGYAAHLITAVLIASLKSRPKRYKIIVRRVQIAERHVRAAE